MNPARTITVNPGRTTLGALNSEESIGFVRTASQIAAAPALPKSKTLASILFSAHAPGAARFGAIMLAVRVLFGAMLMTSGILMLTGRMAYPHDMVAPEVLAIGEIAVGSLLAVGLLTRPAMLVATAVFTAAAVSALILGTFDQALLLKALCSAAFMMLGAGRYSLDGLVRRLGTRLAVRRRRARRALTYRSYLQLVKS